MDFEFTPRVKGLRQQVEQFLDLYMLPYNTQWHRETMVGRYPMEIMEPLKQIARSEGLWNLFLPGLRDDEPGTRLTNLEYAPLAEIMGRLPWASEAFNCNAPDSGNMELLHLFATPEQSAQWLVPLLEGEIRSCFAMSEPDVASSDATNIRTSIRREGDEYVLNGRKWFITGPLHPLCKFAIVMGVSSDDDTTSVHARHSMVIVPTPPTVAGMRFDRSFMAINAALEGLGVCLDSTRLAERELKAGRLVLPLAENAAYVSENQHYLVYPKRNENRPILKAFSRWLSEELM